MALEEVSLEHVQATIGDTVLKLWTDLLQHLPFLVAGAVVLVATAVVVAIFKRFSGRLLARWRLRSSLKDLISRLAVLGFWALGLLIAALIVFPGLTPAKAIGGLGVVSVAIGFAFKDIFENFFAGVLILLRFPVEKGDYIECEGIMGRVEEVTIRMSELRRPSGELVVVPNSFLFKNPVEVLTYENVRRVTIVVGIAYGEDVASSVEVIESAVEGCASVDSSEPVQVYPMAFGSSSIDIEVAWWTDPEPGDVRRSRGEVVTAIKKALDDADIEIPFPYRTLTFPEPLRVISGDGDGRGNDRRDG